MFVTHCYICNQPRGFARRLGFGTFFMALITLGLWLFTIPLYPLRCTTCGCTRGQAGPAPGQPSMRGVFGSFTPWEIIFGALIILGILAAILGWPTDRLANQPANPSAVETPTQTTPVIAQHKPVEYLHGKLRLTVDESLDGPKEIRLWPNQRGSVFMSNGYLVNPKSQMRIPKMDFLCVASQPSCDRLIPGMTYGVDVVQPGETGYAVPSSIAAIFGCIRIYGPDGVYIYAIGTNSVVGLPSVSELNSPFSRQLRESREGDEARREQELMHEQMDEMESQQ